MVKLGLRKQYLADNLEKRFSRSFPEFERDPLLSKEVIGKP